MSTTHPDPREIAAKGIAIYNRKYRAEFEQRYRDQFAAIDLESERAFLADFPEEALARAKEAAPNGVFYLLRVGSPGAFKISRVKHVADGRV